MRVIELRKACCPSNDGERKRKREKGIPMPGPIQSQPGSITCGKWKEMGVGGAAGSGCLLCWERERGEDTKERKKKIRHFPSSFFTFGPFSSLRPHYAAKHIPCANCTYWLGKQVEGGSNSWWMFFCHQAIRSGAVFIWWRGFLPLVGWPVEDGLASRSMTHAGTWVFHILRTLDEYSPWPLHPLSPLHIFLLFLLLLRLDHERKRQWREQKNQLGTRLFFFRPTLKLLYLPVPSLTLLPQALWSPLLVSTVSSNRLSKSIDLVDR